ncbi:hypothetical protein ACFUC1_18145 [Pedococcus sp. NPDC057267]
MSTRSSHLRRRWHLWQRSSAASRVRDVALVLAALLVLAVVVVAMRVDH